MKRVHNRSTVTHRDGYERGAVIIELALILPFLVILFVTIIDLGLLIREYQIVQNGAREGARFSSLPQNCISCRPADCQGQPPGCKTQTEIQTEIENRVIDYMSQEGITITASAITINQCFPMSVTVGGSTVTVFASQVTVSYNRSLLISVVGIGNATLTGRGVFRDLYGPPCP